MPQRRIPREAKAVHCRELARWTSDGRTRHILIDMAAELETGAAEAEPEPHEDPQPPLPRSLS